MQDPALAFLDDGTVPPPGTPDEDLCYPCCFRDASELRLPGTERHRLTSMDAEDRAWQDISAAEEELRTREALASLKAGDESIPELLLTRLMERGMLTPDEAGEAAEDLAQQPRGHRLRDPCRRQAHRATGAAA